MFCGELKTARRRKAQLTFHRAEFALLGHGHAADEPWHEQPEEGNGFNRKPKLGIFIQGFEPAKCQRANVQHQQAEADEETDLMRLEFFPRERVKSPCSGGRDGIIRPRLCGTEA